MSRAKRPFTFYNLDSFFAGIVFSSLTLYNEAKPMRIVIGQAQNGRYLRVIYVPDPEPNSVFVITAYELRGKPLAAYRRRQRKRR